MKTSKELELDIVASLTCATRGGEVWPEKKDVGHILLMVQNWVDAEPNARTLLAICEICEAYERNGHVD